MDWLDLLAVQGTLKSLLQHHSSKASILWCSAFFMVQLSYLYVTIGKTIALTTCIFVGRVMSLLLNTLSRFVTVFLLRSKCLLISSCQGTGVRQGVVPTHGKMKRWAPDPRATPLLWNLPPSCAPGTQPLL